MIHAVNKQVIIILNAAQLHCIMLIVYLLHGMRMWCNENELGMRMDWNEIPMFLDKNK